MSKPFTFRHANQLSGALVLLAISLFIVGIFLAGQSQRWFEGTFTVHARFLAQDGSASDEGGFGLQAGNEVRFQNGLVGRVGEFYPTPQGHMRTTFIIQNRYRPYISTHVVGRVKKKFGVAGDSFVEIDRTEGPPIQPNDVITCTKDLELMESAQTVLKEVQTTALPMLSDVQQSLSRVNVLLGLLEKGEGLAGAVLTDGDLTEDVRTSLANVNQLLVDSQETLADTRLLIQGMQKHWLLRKYVNRARALDPLVPCRMSNREVQSYSRRLRRRLDAARSADGAAEIARTAYNLSICHLAASDPVTAARLAREAERGAQKAGVNPTSSLALRGEIQRQAGDLDGAEAQLARARTTANTAPSEARLLLAVLAGHVACDRGNPETARHTGQAIETAIRSVDSPASLGNGERIIGRILLMQGQPEAAASAFSRAATQFRKSNLLFEMARCLEDAGHAYGASGANEQAVDHCLRAARSLLAQGERRAAAPPIARAAFWGKDLPEDTPVRLQALEMADQLITRNPPNGG